MNSTSLTRHAAQHPEVTAVLAGRHRYGQAATFPDWAAAERAEQMLAGALAVRRLYTRRRLFSRRRPTRHGAR